MPFEWVPLSPWFSITNVIMWRVGMRTMSDAVRGGTSYTRIRLAWEWRTWSLFAFWRLHNWNPLVCQHSKLWSNRLNRLIVLQMSMWRLAARSRCRLTVRDSKGWLSRAPRHRIRTLGTPRTRCRSLVVRSTLNCGYRDRWYCHQYLDQISVLPDHRDLGPSSFCTESAGRLVSKVLEHRGSKWSLRHPRTSAEWRLPELTELRVLQEYWCEKTWLLWLRRITLRFMFVWWAVGQFLTKRFLYRYRCSYHSR